MNRIILMKVLGQATADHMKKKKQYEQAGDKMEACIEEEMIQNIYELVDYIVHHPDFGDYQ